MDLYIKKSECYFQKGDNLFFFCFFYTYIISGEGIPEYNLEYPFGLILFSKSASSIWNLENANPFLRRGARYLALPPFRRKKGRTILRPNTTTSSKMILMWLLRINCNSSSSSNLEGSSFSSKLDVPNV